MHQTISVITLGIVLLSCQWTTAQNTWTISDTLDRDGKYNVTRKVDMDNSRIEFEVNVETTGFVGFGLSYTGDMVGADIIIGGVFPNKTTYFTDRHATSRSTPIIDDHQDWFLISSSEADGVTTLKFYRAFHTCDDQDIPITDDTLKMIWSYGLTDEIVYHGIDNRGILSVNLLDPPQPNPDTSNLKEWHVLIEDTMPTQDTSYWCSMHKAPEVINKKMFMVGFDAEIIGKVAEEHTHHFILRRCIIPQDDKTEEILNKRVGQPGIDCQVHHPDEPIQFCQSYMFVWAKGGQRTMFPDKVGFPIGEHPGKEYFMLEIHYDNPHMKPGVKFTTGLKVYYTDEREIDAGLMGIGHNVYFGHTIPPNSQNFVTIGHCSSDCTRERIPPTGIKIFNILLHSHLSGRKLKVRQIRDGKEMAWPAVDDNYDFNYQQNRPLRQELTVLPGDHLIYECTTDTTWKNGQVTIGDLSTRDEMCEAFLIYYPRIDLDFCASIPDINQTMAVLGIDEMIDNEANYNNPIVTAPASMAGMTYTEALEKVVNWTPRLREAFQNQVRFTDHIYQCATFDGNIEPTRGVVKYPHVHPYEPKDPCLTNENDPGTTTTTKESSESESTDKETSTTEKKGEDTTVKSTTLENDETTSTTEYNSASWEKLTVTNLMFCMIALVMRN